MNSEKRDRIKIEGVVSKSKRCAEREMGIKMKV